MMFFPSVYLTVSANAWFFGDICYNDIDTIYPLVWLRQNRGIVVLKDECVAYYPFLKIHKASFLAWPLFGHSKFL